MGFKKIDEFLFEDSWFTNLSKDAKILWIYYLTKCDIAGIHKINHKIARTVTEVEDPEHVLQEFGDRLWILNGEYVFIRKYLEFQQPGFPNENNKYHKTAIKRLKEFGLYDEEKQCVVKDKNLFKNNYNKYKYKYNDNYKGGVKRGVKRIRTRKQGQPPPPSIRNIIPPLLSTVIDYCKHRNNDVDPEKWYDFYQARNWAVGKVRMKDWQASIRTWEHNNKQWGSPTQQKFMKPKITTKIKEYDHER